MRCCAQKLILHLINVVLVVVLFLRNLCKLLKNWNAVLLNDLLLTGAIVAHFEQDQLAVVEEHLAGRVRLWLILTRHSFDLRARDRRLRVTLVSLDRVINDLQVVQAPD